MSTEKAKYPFRPSRAHAWKCRTQAVTSPRRFKKELVDEVHSGMHSDKTAKRTLAQLIDSTEVDREILSGARLSRRRKHC